jgi:hypothetical protein
VSGRKLNIDVKWDVKSRNEEEEVVSLVCYTSSSWRYINGIQLAIAVNNDMTFCVTKIKYIMYNVQDYGCLCNDSFRSVICED